MTKEELLRENQELKDRMIELQSEVIRLKTIDIPREPSPKEISPFEPYWPTTTGDPLPTPYTTDLQFYGDRIEVY